MTTSTETKTLTLVHKTSHRAVDARNCRIAGRRRHHVQYIYYETSELEEIIGGKTKAEYEDGPRRRHKGYFSRFRR